MKIILSILLLFSGIAYGQVFQTNNVPYKFRGLIGDSINKIPAATDTPYMVNPKWGENIDGALFLRKSDSTLWAKIGPRWVLMGGQNALDSSDFTPVIDSTGNESFRVLYAVNGRISGNSTFTFDTTSGTLYVERIQSGVSVIDTLYINEPPESVASYDPATDPDNFVLLWDATTGKVKQAQWAASGVTTAYNTISQLNDTTITIVRTDATRDTLVFETGTVAEPGYLVNVSVTGNYSILSTDNTIFCKTNNMTVTLPTAVGRAGKYYNIKVISNIVVTVATTSSQTIDGNLTQTLNQYDNMTVISDGINWHII